MKMGVCVKLKMLVSAMCVVILLAMIGCKKEMYTPDEPVVDPENVFDFSTREKYMLHVKYDVPENYKVYFDERSGTVRCRWASGEKRYRAC